MKSFIKLEAYPEFKEGRAINSRSDRWKAYCGRYAKAVEDEVYKLPQFIKHTPVPERPAVIMECDLANTTKHENDYKSYEAHFVPTLMRICEFKVYRRVLANHPQFCAHNERAMAGKSKLVFGDVGSAVVEGRRLSGEMFTSVGNGVTNLMTVEFICEQNGIQLVKSFVEGDDGLFVTTKPLTAKMFKDCGFTVEINEVEDPGHAHFCGMSCSKDLELVKDIRRVLSTFGWTSSYINAGNNIMDELLRSKALSLAYEMPQCPIVGQIARTALELTEGVQPNHHEERYGIEWSELSSKVCSDFPEFAPHQSTRELYRDLYGVDIPTQLAAEEAIRCCDWAAVAQLIPPVLNPDDMTRRVSPSSFDRLSYSIAYLECD